MDQLAATDMTYLEEIECLGLSLGKWINLAKISVPILLYIKTKKIYCIVVRISGKTSTNTFLVISKLAKSLWFQP